MVKVEVLAKVETWIEIWEQDAQALGYPYVLTP